jgi:ring-1,2-phenylacetyl-CoA epoxidase subunit PaaE
MSTHFYPLRVIDVRQETADCVSVAFSVEPEDQSKFKFSPGQYLTFKKVIDGHEQRRSYSICTSPLDGELRVAIKKLNGGVFSTWANEKLKVGDILESMPPLGRFTMDTHPQQEKHYLMVAAGSGITPIMSLIKTILVSEPKSHVSLIYGNKNKSTIIFKNAIEAIKNRYLNRLSVFHVLSRERADADFLCGRIDTQKLHYFLDKILPVNKINDCFLCGPEELIISAKDVLIARGLDINKIHFELFFSSLSKVKKNESTAINVEKGKVSSVSLKLDGFETLFDLAYQGESILDAALKNGVDLPFACKGGVCATCRAKVEIGSVEMDVNYSLAPDELAAGFVLTCQSHPRSKEVRVNFDIK